MRATNSTSVTVVFNYCTGKNLKTRFVARSLSPVRFIDFANRADRFVERALSSSGVL